MRAYVDLLKAPSAPAMFEKAADVRALEANIERLTTARAALAEAADAGDPDASAQYDELTRGLERSARGLERSKLALDQIRKRQAEAAAAAAEQARAIRANALNARLDAICASGEAEIRDAAYLLGERIRDALREIQSLSNDAGLSAICGEVMLNRLRADLGFAFHGILPLPAPDTKPVSPFARFAEDTRADLARIGLAPAADTPTTEEKSIDA